MPKIYPLLILMSLSLSGLMAQNKKNALAHLDKNRAEYEKVAQQIWEWAELGYLEDKSSSLLQSTLEKAGFQIEKGVAGIPTAFVASYGSGKPVIGILAEFDALPGISQDNVPEKQARKGSNAGHACGHHLFGTASSAAAMALKDYLEKSGKKGTIRLYGTPAEEGGAGKVYMVRAGLFSDVDAVLHWHPGSRNDASAGSSLANKSAKFRFYGTASHAAAAPQNGRSALDAVEAMNFMVNMMREHIPEKSRMHYVITRGGEAPNVVPAFAEVYYYIRHPEREVVQRNFDWVVKAAEGAAIGTETRMDYEVIHGVYNLKPNGVLAELVHKNMESLGGFEYTPEEKAFAEKIKQSFPKHRQQDLNLVTQVNSFSVSEDAFPGSTDVGDISWVVPTAGLSTATWVPGTSAHSWQAVAAGGMSIGHKGMMLAAKTLAITGIDLFEAPAIIEKAQKELDERVGANFEYTPLLGKRKPPLDYRK